VPDFTISLTLTGVRGIIRHPNLFSPRLSDLIQPRRLRLFVVEDDALSSGYTGKVPVPTLERLATYLRYLIDLEQDQVDTISSAEVEEQTGINAAQFRKDLSYFGEFGKPGVGYNVHDLQSRTWLRPGRLSRPEGASLQCRCRLRQ
jgi:hypothetical protein